MPSLLLGKFIKATKPLETKVCIYIQTGDDAFYLHSSSIFLQLIDRYGEKNYICINSLCPITEMLFRLLFLISLEFDIDS